MLELERYPMSDDPLLMYIGRSGESTTDTDLVAWVSFGLQHLPRAEDVPVVTNMGAGFSIKPWNYFDGLPTRHLREAPHSKQCAPRLESPTPSDALQMREQGGYLHTDY
jgi:hypothetical protein